MNTIRINGRIFNLDNVKRFYWIDSETEGYLPHAWGLSIVQLPDEHINLGTSDSAKRAWVKLQEWVTFDFDVETEIETYALGTTSAMPVSKKDIEITRLKQRIEQLESMLAKANNISK